jgi:hypothetical protein
MGLGGVFLFVVMLITAWTGEPLYSPGPSGLTREGLIVAAWSTGCGMALCGSSIEWWRGRWWTALSLIVGCVLAAQILRLTGIMPE